MLTLIVYVASFIAVCLFIYIARALYQLEKIRNRLRQLLSVQLTLSGVNDDTEFDPISDVFITGYVIKFACDFADINQFNNRWGLVHAALKLVFGKKAPKMSQTEDFANNFDSDGFIQGVDCAENDLKMFMAAGTPTLSLLMHIKKTYSSQ